MKILVLNSGSSSQKSALFELGLKPSADPIPALWEGKLEWDGNKETVTIKNSAGKKIQSEMASGGRESGAEKLLENLWSGPTASLKNASEIDGIGHRIVHASIRDLRVIREHASPGCPISAPGRAPGRLLAGCCICCRTS